MCINMITIPCYSSLHTVLLQRLLATIWHNLKQIRKKIGSHFVQRKDHHCLRDLQPRDPEHRELCLRYRMLLLRHTFALYKRHQCWIHLSALDAMARNSCLDDDGAFRGQPLNTNPHLPTRLHQHPRKVTSSKNPKRTQSGSIVQLIHASCNCLSEPNSQIKHSEKLIWPSQITTKSSASIIISWFTFTVKIRRVWLDFITVCDATRDTA